MYIYLILILSLCLIKFRYSKTDQYKKVLAVGGWLISIIAIINMIYALAVYGSIDLFENPDMPRFISFKSRVLFAVLSSFLFSYPLNWFLIITRKLFYWIIFGIEWLQKK